MLRNGSTGDDVTTLQEQLETVGHDPGKIDGIFGPKTLAAVKAFQEASDLQADGIAGPKTLSALAEAVADATEPSVLEKAKQIMADRDGDDDELTVQEKARQIIANRNADDDDKGSSGLKGF